MDLFLSWIQQNPDWLLAAFFFIALTETLPIIGWVVPGIGILFSLSAISGSASIPKWEILTSAALGGFLGDFISFMLGRTFREDIYKLPKLRKYQHWFKRGEQFFEKHGTFSIVLGRFFGPLRPIIPLTAGVMELPLKKFLFVSVSVSLPWAIFYCMPGYITGQTLDENQFNLFYIATFMIVLIIAELIIRFLLHLRINPRPEWKNTSITFLFLFLLIVLLAFYGFFDTLEERLADLRSGILSDRLALDKMFALVSLSSSLLMVGIYLMVSVYHLSQSTLLLVRSHLLMISFCIGSYFLAHFVIALFFPNFLPIEINSHFFLTGHTFLAFITTGLVLIPHTLNHTDFKSQPIISYPLQCRILVYWTAFVSIAKVYFQANHLMHTLFSMLLGLFFIFLYYQYLTHTSNKPREHLNHPRLITLICQFILILLVFSAYAFMNINKELELSQTFNI